MAKNGAKQGQSREVGPGKPPVEHQFKPGQSGNPNGRPPERPIAAAIKRLLEKDEAKGIDAIAAVAVREALQGDYRWGREVIDRIDGRLVEPHDITSGGKPVRSSLVGLSEETTRRVLKELGGPEYEQYDEDDVAGDEEPEAD